ncbi:MAG: IS200/IS605 family transposase [Prevotellaceae bacterium]|nr:IS200/IS605 family transposase [Prevotellaceae bacterium]
MNSYRQILYHIVFCTYRRENTLPEQHHKALYSYIWGIIKNRNCVLYQINGTENHIHILSDLHPSIALADYVKEIKTASNKWMHESGNFPNFRCWAEGYCALTYAYRDKNLILNYIKKQKEHHKKDNFENEYLSLLKKNGVEYDIKYVF